MSDSTLAYDRDIKLPLYARHAIPHVLNVVVTDGAVVHYSVPRDNDYRRTARYTRGDTFTIEILPSVTIAIVVDGLFS